MPFVLRQITGLLDLGHDVMRLSGGLTLRELKWMGDGDPVEVTTRR